MSFERFVFVFRTALLWQDFLECVSATYFLSQCRRCRLLESRAGIEVEKRMVLCGSLRSQYEKAHACFCRAADVLLRLAMGLGLDMLGLSLAHSASNSIA